MKKLFMVCALSGFLFTGCNTTPDNQETTITETEMETAPADTAGAKMDNTRVEIEQASADVDSLLNEL
jgi:uncharacterized lipoprotein YajG